MGLLEVLIDNTLFIKLLQPGIFVAQIYVDDIIFGSTCEKEVVKFVDLMTSEFEMSLIGDLSFFLGLQIKQTDQGIFISQSKYVRKMLEKFGLDHTKHAPTPLSTTTKLSRDESGESVDPTLYRGMIGSLLYLTASRPDICFSVGLCARYQANPKQSHLSAVKRIFKYLSGTSEFGLWYSRDTNMSIVGYSDSDWAGSLDDRKSTSGGCFYLGNNLVSWLSKKQNSISLSTAEAEYIAAGSCCTQLIWLNKMVTDYGFPQNSLVLYCDSTSAINISKNPVQHSRTKHIDIRYHFIRHMVLNLLIYSPRLWMLTPLLIFTAPLEFALSDLVEVASYMSQQPLAMCLDQLLGASHEVTSHTNGSWVFFLQIVFQSMGVCF
ncbi:uncharacterized mitochondrial protein AtMg00810-like [Cannabis sativa]|uniref:uncharacterized mitochondrial protein AtMg00810-like n=1 Tax=Cannabis sativa TaxID=3483 RepID=UPI0029CA3B4A|nr:uncharacterized mitochondrial protein AtMg00810-like [Cannabis sativa]